MPSISFLDSTGFATLTNGKSVPRVNAWTPRRVPVGPKATGLGTGRIHMFEFRTDDLVQFSLDNIPGTDANMQIMLRLQAHLLRGGEINLDAGRTALASNWAACTLAPDTEPEIQFSDRDALEYSFAATLRTTGATSASYVYPSFVPGLKLWLKGDNETMAGTLENEDFVGGWYDDSGEGNDAVQAEGAAQPRYYTNVANGYPVVRFDGVDDRLHTPDIMVPTDAPGTIMLWVMRRLDAGTLDNQVFWSFRNSSQANGTMTSAVLEHASTSLNNVKWNVKPDSSPALISTDTADAFTVYALEFASTSSVTPYVNGVAGTPFAVHTDIASTNQVRIGRVGGLGEEYAAQFDMAEMLWYQGIISASDRNGLVNYLALKYAITLP